MNTEAIIREFELLGYRWVSGEYERCNSYFQVQCLKCGQEKRLMWEQRVKNSRCLNCYYSNKRKDLYQRIQHRVVNELNFKLHIALDEFLLKCQTHKGEEVPFEVECQKGHKTLTTWKRIRRYSCGICSGVVANRGGSHILKLRDRGWEWIRGEYTNRNSPMVCRCLARGHEQQKKYNSFLQQGCVLCQPLSRIVPRVETIQAIVSEGYEVIFMPEEVKNTVPFRLRCPHGHEFNTTRHGWVSDRARCPYCSQAKSASKSEAAILNWLSDLGYAAIQGVRVLDQYDIDVYLPEQKLGIEYHGLYFHREDKRGSSYHYKKYLLAKDRGIQLLQFWEDEWLEKEAIVKSIILSKLGHPSLVSIGARKCSIEEVEAQRAAAFLEANHLQGSTKFSKALGLSFRGELVMVATVGRHHRNSNQMVLSRVATRKFHTIPGGMSRILKILPKPIITWSDNRISQGISYEKLGFVKDGELPPDYQYVRGNRRYSKQSLKKSPGDAKSELEIRTEQGYHRLWDAGKIRWVIL